MVDYAAPVVSNVAANALPTGGGTVTISGLNFAAIDPTGTASLELSVQCSSASWTSATLVTCDAASIGGGRSGTTVTVAAVVGSLIGQFSYDGTGGCACVRLATRSIAVCPRCAQLRR